MHVDGAAMALSSSEWLLATCRARCSSPIRTADGGELVVSDTYGEHEVKLPAGDLIVYPSD